MALKKWTTELPGDMLGQKTTAIPIANLGEAEWVTPVHISSSTSLPVNVTFPASLNVIDATARTSLAAIDTKLAGTLTVADTTARTSLAAIDTKLGGTLKAQITNFPATQPVSGSVSVSNFPATQPVSGSVSVTGTATVAGSVSITGTPTVSVSGTASVSDATARTSLASIDTKLSGTLNISDANGTAKLTTIDTKLGGTLNVNDANGTAKLTTIDTKLGGTLNVADATARTSLAAIDTKLGGTLNISDTNGTAKLTAIDSKLGGTIKTTDDNTVAELELLKAELVAIKAELASVLDTKITESTIMQPVEVQGNLQTTIQTQNGVAVSAGSVSTGSGWIDTAGFNQVAGTLITSVGTVATNITVNWSNDGINIHGVDNIIINGQGAQRSGVTDTKARYMQTYLYNGNVAGQPPSTMSGWVYLKA